MDNNEEQDFETLICPFMRKQCVEGYCNLWSDDSQCIFGKISDNLEYIANIMPNLFK